MSRFLFVHRVPQAYKLGEPDNVAAWLAWFEGMGANRVDRGNAVIETRSAGNLGAGTRLGGYLVVTADDLDAALAVAKGSPSLGLDGGIEVGQIGTPPRARWPQTMTWR
jgi:hypothetical protein